MTEKLSDAMKETLTGLYPNFKLKAHAQTGAALLRRGLVYEMGAGYYVLTRAGRAAVEGLRAAAAAEVKAAVAKVRADSEAKAAARAEDVTRERQPVTLRQVYDAHVGALRAGCISRTAGYTGVSSVEDVRWNPSKGWPEYREAGEWYSFALADLEMWAGAEGLDLDMRGPVAPEQPAPVAEQPAIEDLEREYVRADDRVARLTLGSGYWPEMDAEIAAAREARTRAWRAWQDAKAAVAEQPAPEHIRVRCGEPGYAGCPYSKGPRPVSGEGACEWCEDRFRDPFGGLADEVIGGCDCDSGEAKAWAALQAGYAAFFALESGPEKRAAYDALAPLRARWEAAANAELATIEAAFAASDVPAHQELAAIAAKMRSDAQPAPMCPDCDGDGTVFTDWDQTELGECVKCGGTGAADPFGGLADEVIGGCDCDSGEIECDSCGGLGGLEAGYECLACGGDGWVDCPRCAKTDETAELPRVEQPRKCDRCDGFGVWQRRCNACNGSGCPEGGYEACYYCKGHGWFNNECGECLGTGVL